MENRLGFEDFEGGRILHRLATVGDEHSLPLDWKPADDYSDISAMYRSILNRREGDGDLIDTIIAHITKKHYTHAIGVALLLGDPSLSDEQFAKLLPGAGAIGFRVHVDKTRINSDELDGYERVLNVATQALINRRFLNDEIVNTQWFDWIGRALPALQRKRLVIAYFEQNPGRCSQETLAHLKSGGPHSVQGKGISTLFNAVRDALPPLMQTWMRYTPQRRARLDFAPNQQSN